MSSKRTFWLFFACLSIAAACYALYLGLILDPASCIDRFENSYGGHVALMEKPRASVFPPAVRIKKLSWQNSFPWGDISVEAPECVILADKNKFFMGSFEIARITLTEPVAEIRLDSAFGRIPEETLREIAGVGRLVVQKGSLNMAAGNIELSLAGLNISLARQEKTGEVKCDLSFGMTVVETSPEGAASPAATSEKLFGGNLAFRARLHFLYPNLSLHNAALAFTPDPERGHKALHPFRINLDGNLNLTEKELRILNGRVITPSRQWDLKNELWVWNPNLPCILAGTELLDFHGKKGH